MRRIRGSEVVVEMGSMMTERLGGRGEGWEGGGVTRVGWDDGVVRVLVMGQRMGRGAVVRHGGHRGGGGVDNRGRRLVSGLQRFVSGFWR